MPGDLIKLFDTQADWQSGALENLDATSTPGVIIPTGDYTKTYDSKAEWDQGTKANVVSDAEGRIMLDRPLRGNTSLGSTGQYEYDEVFMGQRISPRGLLAEVRMYVGASSGIGRSMFVTNLSGNVLWSQSMSSHGLWVGYPNLLVSEDVIVWVRALDWLYSVARAATDDYPPGVTENGRIGSSLATQPNYYRPLWVQYRCEYAESGTWLSPWLAHGISSPQSGLVSLRAETPSGTGVIPHVRYSSDGGSTYTQWYDLDDRRMTDLQGTHVQLRLTLTTDDTKQTPVVDRAMLLVGKLHRWTSPAIDLTGVGADADLMLATSQTELDVVREVREYPNFTFTRSSTAYLSDGTEVAANVPRFEEVDGETGLLVEEGTTNLIPIDKQNFENWTTHSGASVTITQNQTVEEWGTSKATRIQTSGGTHVIKYYLNIWTPADGESYLAAESVWIKVPPTSPPVRIYSNLGARSTYIQPGESKRISITVSGIGNGITQLHIQIRAPNVDDSLDFYAWRPQAEKKPYATSFHPATRAAETLLVPTAGLSPTKGMWEQRVYVTDVAKRQSGYPTIFNIPQNNGDAGIWLYHDSANWVLETRDFTGASTSVNVSDSYTPNGHHTFHVSWNTSKAVLSIDGVERGVIDNPNLPSAFAEYATVGYSGTGNYLNTHHGTIRHSSEPRTDLSDWETLPLDEWTTYKMAGGPWESVGAVFPCSGRQTLQARLTLTKTDSVAQSLDSVALWEPVLMWMYDRPNLRVSPPQVTHVTVYVENSEPVVEYTASIAVEESKKIHIRVPVPEGSSLAYCQQVAEKVLALKSEERLSITCKIPLLTRMRFGESVAVVMPYAGYTRENPYFGVIQKMTHYPLASPPYTEIQIGEYLPEDIEVLLRLYSSQKGGV